MRFATIFSSLVALCAHSALAEYTLRIWDIQGNDVTIQRVWYGDGATYVGPTIPPEVKTAFNFTVDDARRDLFFVKVDRENSGRSGRDLPDPTFLVAKAGPGAKDSFAFAHSAVGLTHEDIYLFGGVEGFWYPRTRDSVARGGTYLVPTSVRDTYQVRWIVDAADVAALDAKPVTLATRGDI